MKDKKSSIFNIFILVLTAIIVVASFYVKYTLADTKFETLVFYSISNLDNADLSPLYTALKICIPIIILLSILIIVCFYDLKRIKINSKIDKKIHINKHKWLYTITCLIISIALLIYSVGIPEYLYYMSQKSDFIKNNYITPSKDKINLNNNKRNLIIITVESLEYSLFTKEQNGIWDYELISELHDILEDKDTSTFNNKKGMYMLHGASYTTGSIITNRSGIPVKIGLDRYGYSKNNFMKNNYTLGDYLKENNYNNEIISGARTSYGGLDYFYKNHGDYKIIDPSTLNDYNYKLKKDDYGKWGFNDKYIFEIAKDRLEKLSNEEKPFNLELLTIDTHFVDGYVGNYSETKYKRQYENAYATTSKLIKEFIEYVKKQPFYDNTTIVIMGDHLTMQSNFINYNMFKDRTMYFCIINSVNKNDKKDRIFTSLDTYPTIISSIGGIIEEDRLGLGVNLYSNKKTLAEKYGVKELDNELKKKSTYYNKNILGRGE